MTKGRPSRALRTVVVLLMAAVLLSPMSRAHAQLAATGYGGGPRTRAPLDDAPLRVQSAGSWGPYSSAGGSHHRLGGSLSIMGWPTEWLSIGGRVEGHFDIHPDDAQGSDRSLQGEPALLLGGSFRRAGGGAGLLLDVRFIGAGAPSVDLSATSLDLRAWGARRFGAWTLMANAGYRLDRSRESIDDPSRLRSGDRHALQVSEADALLASLAVSGRFGRWEPVLEVSWEPWLGGPAIANAPLRVAAALRAHLDSVTLSLGAEARMTANAPVDGPTTVPFDPRIRVFVAVAYSWRPQAAIPPAAQTGDAEPELETPNVERPSAERVVTGQVMDATGAPVSGATVALRRGDETLGATETEADGSFRIATPTAEGPDDALVLLGAGGEVVASLAASAPGPLRLEVPPREPTGALRGLIRNFQGDPLAATVTVGEATNTTDDEGRFEIELPAGRHEVTVDSEGYRSQTRRIRIGDDGVTVLNVELRPSR